MSLWLQPKNCGLYHAGDRCCIPAEDCPEGIASAVLSNTDKSSSSLLLGSVSCPLPIFLVLDELLFFLFHFSSFFHPDLPICWTYPISSGCLFDLSPGLLSQVRRTLLWEPLLLSAFSFPAIEGAMALEWHSSLTPHLIWCLHFLISFPSPGNWIAPQYGYKLLPQVVTDRFQGQNCLIFITFFHLRLNVTPRTSQKSWAKNWPCREDSILTGEETNSLSHKIVGETKRSQNLMTYIYNHSLTHYPTDVCETLAS